MPAVSVDIKAIVGELSQAGSKEALVEKYSTRMREIQDFYGNLSDIPPDPNEEYWLIRAKLSALATLKDGS
jgi:hypothetical protein